MISEAEEWQEEERKQEAEKTENLLNLWKKGYKSVPQHNWVFYEVAE